MEGRAVNRSVSWSVQPSTFRPTFKNKGWTDKILTEQIVTSIRPTVQPYLVNQKKNWRVPERAISLRVPDPGVLKVDSWTDAIYPLWNKAFRRPSFVFEGWPEVDRMDGFTPRHVMSFTS